MPYDYQLVCGSLLIAVGVLSFLAALVEQRRPLLGLLLVIIGGGLVGWAWDISEEDLVLQDVPDALFRIIGAWLS